MFVGIIMRIVVIIVMLFFCILIPLPTLSLLSKGGQGEHTDFWPSPPFDPPCPRIWPMCTWDKRFTLLTQIFTFQAAEFLQVPCLRSSAGKDDQPAARFRPNDLLLLTRQQPEDLGQGAPPKYLQMVITHLSLPCLNIAFENPRLKILFPHSNCLDHPQIGGFALPRPPQYNIRPPVRPLENRYFWEKLRGTVEDPVQDALCWVCRCQRRSIPVKEKGTKT